jgi:hypothetical protein
MRKSLLAMVTVVGFILACGGGSDPWSSMDLPQGGEIVGSNASSLSVQEHMGTTASVKSKWVGALEKEGWRVDNENANAGSLYVDLRKDSNALLLSVSEMGSGIRVNLTGNPG